MLSASQTTTARGGWFAEKNCLTSNVASFRTILPKSFLRGPFALDIDLSISFLKVSIRASKCSRREGVARRDKRRTEGPSWSLCLITMVAVLIGQGWTEWSWLNYWLAYCTHKTMVGHTHPSHFDCLLYNDVVVWREKYCSALPNHLSAEDTQLLSGVWHCSRSRTSRTARQQIASHFWSIRRTGWHTGLSNCQKLLLKYMVLTSF